MPDDARPIADLVAELLKRGFGTEGGDQKLRDPQSGDSAGPDWLKTRRSEVLAYLETTSSRAVESPLLSGNEPRAFAGVGGNGFSDMLDLDRLVSRSSEFDTMILSADSHSWSPLDNRYLDFDAPFDTASQPMLSEGAFACLRASCVQARLTKAEDRTRFINTVCWMRFSNLLHGEQGALNLSASLCSILRDPGAQEFAANQTREEARHVAAFARFIKTRWGRPAPPIPALRDFLHEIVDVPDVTKKIVGMQVMVEGLAMGSLGSLFRSLLDPVGKRLVQLVMTDETFHHRFGKLWAEETMPSISPEARARLEDWTAHCLSDFILKMNPPYELQILFNDFGLSPVQIAREMRELGGDRLADTAFGAGEIFRVLTQTLLQARLLSAESQRTYAAYLASEAGGEEGAYNEIVRDGLAFLKEVNGDRRNLSERIG